MQAANSGHINTKQDVCAVETLSAQWLRAGAPKYSNMHHCRAPSCLFWQEAGCLPRFRYADLVLSLIRQQSLPQQIHRQTLMQLGTQNH